MTSVVGQLQAVISGVRLSLHAEVVTYARGVTEIAITEAARGSTNWEAAAPHPSVRVGDRSVDWLIAVDDLVSESVELEPQRGDTITDAAGRVYRVMPFGPQSQLWQWHDRDGMTVRRIHTKERPQ